MRVLGVGGFGSTYLAFDHHLNGPVAIKEYFYAGLAARGSDGTVAPGSASNAAGFDWGRGRFLAEARLLARLDHPNVVRVHRCLRERAKVASTRNSLLGQAEGDALHACRVRGRGREAGCGDGGAGGEPFEEVLRVILAEGVGFGASAGVYPASMVVGVGWSFLAADTLPAAALTASAPDSACTLLPSTFTASLPWEHDSLSWFV